MTQVLSDVALLLRLRVRQLLLVEALGREHHLGRAAASLGITQPAATKLLKQAEDALGSTLFTRRARGMEPTPAGAVVVRFARQALVDFGFARQQMAALKSGLHGSLRVGTVPGALPELLAPALLEFRRRHPRVAAAVLVETSDVLLPLLDRGEVDLVLGRPTQAQDGDLDVLPLLSERQVVVVRNGHPLLALPAIGLHDLVRWPWVLQPPGSPQRNRFESALREAGVHARLDITETASTVATTVLLERSEMAAIMPASLAAHYAQMAALQVVPIELPVHVPPIHLMVHRRREPTPAAAGFIAVLREWAEGRAADAVPSRTPGATRRKRGAARNQHAAATPASGR